MPRVVVTFAPPPGVRAALVEELAPLAELVFLPELADEQRATALASTDAVLAWFAARELHGAGELAQLEQVGLLQLFSAGADRVPFGELPARLPVASNAGAYSEPMAEHVLAMALALAKRLPQQHAALARGEWDQRTLNRSLRGALVGILGFGGIGQASARLFRALGARLHALSRSGHSGEPVEALGTLSDLDDLLAAADILVIALPLTRATRGLIGARELALMKADAILVNVARAAIVDEDALYDHLVAQPAFSAGIDTWWEEPHSAGAFTTRRPFLQLPNVLGSPHNSALTPGALESAARHAAANIARQLRGEPVLHLIDRSEYA